MTRVLDTRARTTRDFAHVPLHPLAEWFASNWWFIKSEVQNSAKQDAPDFLRRHALAAGREGYAFPRLEAVPAGSRTQIVWKRDAPKWLGVRFMEQGGERVDSADALEEDPALLAEAARPVEPLARVPMIDGVVHWNGSLPSFAFRGFGPEAQRFGFCRALGETLTSPSDTLIARAHSERQQRNRAFAAEFLAPSDGLMTMLAQRRVGGGGAKTAGNPV